MVDYSGGRRIYQRGRLPFFVENGIKMDCEAAGGGGGPAPLSLDSPLEFTSMEYYLVN